MYYSFNQSIKNVSTLRYDIRIYIYMLILSKAESNEVFTLSESM